MEQNSNTELFNQYMVCKGNLLSVSTPFVLTLIKTLPEEKNYIFAVTLKTLSPRSLTIEVEISSIF